MQPIEYEPWLSKMGVHVVPAFVVFQTPPDATVTYQVLLSRGCTAMSVTRPEVCAGPMPLSASPVKVSAFIFVSSPFSLFSAAAATGRKARAPARQSARVGTNWGRIGRVVCRAGGVVRASDRFIGGSPGSNTG